MPSGSLVASWCLCIVALGAGAARAAPTPPVALVPATATDVPEKTVAAVDAALRQRAAARVPGFVGRGATDDVVAVGRSMGLQCRGDDEACLLKLAVLGDVGSLLGAHVARADAGLELRVVLVDAASRRAVARATLPLPASAKGYGDVAGQALARVLDEAAAAPSSAAPPDAAKTTPAPATTPPIAADPGGAPDAATPPAATAPLDDARGPTWWLVGGGAATGAAGLVVAGGGLAAGVYYDAVYRDLRVPTDGRAQALTASTIGFVAGGVGAVVVVVGVVVAALGFIE